MSKRIVNLTLVLSIVCAGAAAFPGLAAAADRATALGSDCRLVEHAIKPDTCEGSCPTDMTCFAIRTRCYWPSLCVTRQAAECRCVFGPISIPDEPPSDPAPASCATLSDCGPGQWCVQQECRPASTGFAGSCTPRRGCEEAICMAVRNNPTKPTGFDYVGDCTWGTMQLPGVECMCIPY